MFHKSFSFLDPGRLPTTLFMMTIAIQEVITNPDITKIAVVATDQTEVVTTREDLGKFIWEFEIWLTNFVLMVWIWRVECKTEWAKADQGEREFYFACEKKK